MYICTCCSKLCSMCYFLPPYWRMSNIFNIATYCIYYTYTHSYIHTRMHAYLLHKYFFLHFQFLTSSFQLAAAVGICDTIVLSVHSCCCCCYCSRCCCACYSCCCACYSCRFIAAWRVAQVCTQRLHAT